MCTLTISLCATCTDPALILHDHSDMLSLVEHAPGHEPKFGQINPTVSSEEYRESSSLHAKSDFLLEMGNILVFRGRSVPTYLEALHGQGSQDAGAATEVQTPQRRGRKGTTCCIILPPKIRGSRGLGGVLGGA